jgi:diguanylate cyclase (GGDEF)-like protein/PAS domain S-box-containing protein
MRYEQTFAGGQGLVAAGIRVVLVDTSTREERPLLDMLRAAHDSFETLHAGTVAQALSLIPAVGTPTCVLLDLSSSSAGGLEDLEGLHRFAPHAPVVVLSETQDDPAALTALAAGAQDHLVKGRVTAEVLTRSIRYALLSKTSQDALFDMSERFRRAFEDSPLGIALISVSAEESGRVTDANPALTAILGRGLDNLVGSAILDLVDPRDAGQLALELQALGSGSRLRSQGRRRLVGGRGEAVLCSVTTSLLRNPFGGPASIVAMFEDITAQARRDEELACARDALGKAACGIALLDIAGRYASANPAHADALGYDEGELLGVAWQATVDPSDEERVRRAIAQASGGGDGRVEACARRRDGSTFDAELGFVASADVEGRLTGVHVFLRDISERKAVEGALRRSQDQYKRIVETANEGVWITDARGMTTFVNEAMCAMLGCVEADLLGRDVHELVVTEGAPVPAPTPARRASERGTAQRDVRLRHGDGHLVWCLVATSELRGPEGPAGTLAMVTDVSGRRTAEIELAHRALHDCLTSLPNRALLLDRLRQALEQAARGSSTVGVFSIDLDRFKTINDSLGHEAGDQLLQIVAPRLQTALRGTDTLARFGGDEFVVLCPDLAEERDALLVAQRLSAALSEPVETGSGPVSVTASVGIALAGGEGVLAEDMIRDADTAMYRAKERGERPARSSITRCATSSCPSCRPSRSFARR